MTLTKEDRKAGYKYTLKIYENGGYDGGICKLLYEYLVFMGIGPFDVIYWLNHGVEVQFPEFYSFKPVGMSPAIHWFSSTEERIKVLKQCIKMLK